MFQIIEEIVLVGMMAVLAVLDFYKRRISVILLAGLTIFTVAVKIAEGGHPVFWIAGTIPGILFLIIGCITREGVGYGDGWIITLLGIMTGLWDAVCICFVAIFGMAVVSMIGMTVFRWNRKKRIPFVPFLAAGYMGVMLI